MGIKVKKEEYVEEQGPVLEAGERYEAKLTGFGETEGQFGARLVWQFEVKDGKETVEAAGFTSYSMYVDEKGAKTSHLMKWSEALLGSLPDEFDLDDLIGRACRVEIDTYTKESGITKNKVVKVLPPKGNQTAAQKKEEADFQADVEDLSF
jgi:hypothetical protein